MGSSRYDRDICRSDQKLGKVGRKERDGKRESQTLRFLGRQVWGGGCTCDGL
jgi:hypothetical protein